MSADNLDGASLARALSQKTQKLGIKPTRIFNLSEKPATTPCVLAACERLLIDRVARHNRQAAKGPLHHTDECIRDRTMYLLEEFRQHRLDVAELLEDAQLALDLMESEGIGDGYTANLLRNSLARFKDVA